MNACKIRFIEQYIVQYMVQTELSNCYSQYDGKRDNIAAQSAEDALYAAEAAWAGLQIIKADAIAIDIETNTTQLFEE
jgi:hypothetical protein